MAAISTFGSTLKIGPTTSGAYTAPTTTVGEVTSMNLDGIKLNAIDVSGLTDRFRKFIPGMIDSGTISLEVNLDPDDTAQATKVINFLDNTCATTAPVAQSVLVEFGSSTNKGATFSCVGIVTDFSVKGALDSSVTASIQIKVSGSVTFTDVD